MELEPKSLAEVAEAGYNLTEEVPFLNLTVCSLLNTIHPIGS